MSTKDKATLIAEALTKRWFIGEFSHFCDETPTFDLATIEEIAAVIHKVDVDTKEQP